MLTTVHYYTPASRILVVDVIVQHQNRLRRQMTIQNIGTNVAEGLLWMLCSTTAVLMHEKKTDGGVEVQILHFLTSALHWSNS